MPKHWIGWALLSLVAVAWACAVACKSRSVPESDGTASTGTAASTAVPVAGGATAMQRVSDADCARWADHGTDVVVNAFAEAARNCPEKVRDDVASKFVAQKMSLRDGAKALCSQHVNETYRPADGACFLAATNARDLAGCKLKAMTNPDDSDWAQMIDDLRAKCGPRVAPSGAPRSPTL